MPEVSVIIPNYNHAPYLKQRIDSVLHQTYQDIEVIVLDDCSTDGSAGIIEEYRHHPKISHVVFNDRNSGFTFRQWEKGIHLAKGKWIWIAESDDWCETTFLETLLTGVKESPHFSMAFCQSHVVDNDLKILKTSENRLLEEVLPGNDFISGRLVHRNVVINASMCIFKRECYYNVSDRYTGYKFCGDWLFWIEMASLGNVFISGKVLNYFRKHKGDVSSKAYRSGLFFLERLQMIDDLVILKLIGSETKTLLVKSTFQRYNFHKIADKKVNAVLVRKYRQTLGINYYFIRYRSWARKIRNRLFPQY